MNAASVIRQTRMHLRGLLRLCVSLPFFWFVALAVLICLGWYVTRVDDRPHVDPVGLRELLTSAWTVTFAWLLLTQLTRRGRFSNGYSVEAGVPTLPIAPAVRAVVDVMVGASLVLVLVGAVWGWTWWTGDALLFPSVATVVVSTLGIGALTVRLAYRRRAAVEPRSWAVFAVPVAFSGCTLALGAGEATDQALTLAGLGLAAAAALPLHRLGRVDGEHRRPRPRVALHRSGLPPRAALRRDLWDGRWATETLKALVLAVVLQPAILLFELNPMYAVLLATAMPLMAGQYALGVHFRSVRPGNVRDSLGSALLVLPVRSQDAARAVFVHVVVWGVVASVLLAGLWMMLGGALHTSNLDEVTPWAVVAFTMFDSVLAASVYVVMAFGTRWQHLSGWLAFGASVSLGAQWFLDPDGDLPTSIVMLGCALVPCVLAMRYLVGPTRPNRG